ncbi:AAA family ATPase [Brachybacterium hainanense]|uniref:AAA family ATPase n=1 Tax=Brachybacterium hainanense TaxID=1541174 RepID=A0ABV6RBP7_9MICO
MTSSHPVLLLVNGPPGAGKSALARELAAHDPLVTPVDIDAIKHDLPLWPDDPEAAGLVAREVALAETGQELAAGRAVVIGQLLARPEFPAALADLAAHHRARFVHVVLHLRAEELLRRLELRRAAPVTAAQAAVDADLDLEEVLVYAERITAMTQGDDSVHHLDAAAPLPELVAAVRELIVGGSGQDPAAG